MSKPGLELARKPLDRFLTGLDRFWTGLERFWTGTTPKSAEIIILSILEKWYDPYTHYVGVVVHNKPPVRL